MPDDQPAIDPGRKSWIDKITQVFSDEPTDARSLLELLRNAEQDRLLDADALGIIEGAMKVSNMRVREIMIPRPRVATVAAGLSLDETVSLVSRTAHSRFPVVAEDVDDVMGILHAKDLLAAMRNGDPDDFDIKDIMRTAVFVPESKRLNEMLREFREARNHMAIVIDEYGSVSGAVTIEDVLEQIVGNIEDEFDVDGESNFRPVDRRNCSVKAVTPVSEFNRYFSTSLKVSGVSTIGGLLLQRFGHVPERGETLDVDGVRITVLNADKRQVKMLKVTRPDDDAPHASEN